jgi:hypothetical protein
LRIVLALIIFIEIIFGVLYAYNTPHWEAPDEPAHFNYVRQLAETGAFPTLVPGDYDQAFLENIKVAKFPPNLSIDSIRYESYQPPFYYLLATPIYLVARALAVDVVFALRLFSVALSAFLLLLAYFTLRRVFVANQMLALAGVGFIATVPMHIAMSAAINADTLAEVLLAALLLTSIARGQGDLSDRRFVALGGVLYGLALLTSTKIYASALLLILAELGYRGWGLEIRHWRLEIGRWKTLIPLFGIALLLSFWWFARNLLLYGGTDILGWTRHDAVVIGQPTTAEWIARYGFKNIFADFFIITFKSFWAQFGWMGVLVNDRIYIGLFVLSALVSFGALLWVIRLVRTPGEFPRVVLWSWLILGVLLGIIVSAHVWYNLRFVQPQGRYLFPALIPLAALWVAGIYELFEKRYVALIFVLLYVIMLGLDYVSLFWFIVPQLS